MGVIASNLEKSIQAIHAAPQMIVIEFTGAGAQALAWLHGVAGSSRTVLEATDRYAATSLISCLGSEPTQFTSPEVARTMATKAYIRALQLAKPGTSVVGIGSTAAIVTTRAKRGDHRCYVAVCDAQGVTSYTLFLTKGLRTRRQEERLVSLLIIKAIADICGVDGLPQLELCGEETLVKQFEPVDWLGRLPTGEVGWVAVTPNGHTTIGETLPGIAILSGAFNPLHSGHWQLAKVAAKILGQEVYFELPLINADKASIDRAEALRRVAQFVDHGTALLTCAPLFSQKARLFPHSVFVLGIDTVERLIQPRFYHNDLTEMLTSLKTIRIAGCHFLVAGRLEGHRFLTLKDLDMPAGYGELFEAIPEEIFRVDISSTEIRQSKW